MPSGSWDTLSERQLLLTIIELTNPKAPSWDLVSDKMGTGHTKEACRQHFQKIRREARSGNPGAIPTKSPSKASTKTSSSAKSTPTKRKKAEILGAADQDDEECSHIHGDSITIDGDDADSAAGSPGKKMKPEQDQAASAFKIEEKGQEGRINLVAQEDE
ncbi:MAG: hypothetical protein M1827_003498 [Pycnora praestabilis]|nr:MAG: hypothetical protein M1827_003498 [Pycnora praestabilis]